MGSIGSWAADQEDKEYREQALRKLKEYRDKVLTPAMKDEVGLANERCRVMLYELHKRLKDLD